MTDKTDRTSAELLATRATSGAAGRPYCLITAFKSWRRAYYSTRAQPGCTPDSTGTDMARWPIMASLEPEPTRDQLTQAVTVGLCVALAGVLIVLAIV